MTSQDIQLSPIGHVVVDGQGFCLQVDPPYRETRGLPAGVFIVVLGCAEWDDERSTCEARLSLGGKGRQVAARLGGLAASGPTTVVRQTTPASLLLSGSALDRAPTFLTATTGDQDRACQNDTLPGNLPHAHEDSTFLAANSRRSVGAAC